MGSNSTLDRLTISQESTTDERMDLAISGSRTTQARLEKKSEKAVYAYIQAIRARGRKQVNTEEIAEALSMPIDEVERAALSLRKKGVKAIHV